MKTFLITGGGSGIGLATARVLAEEGARVVVAWRSAERLALARKEIGVETVVADMSKPADVEALMERAGELTGSSRTPESACSRSSRRSPRRTWIRCWPRTSRACTSRCSGRG